MTLPIVSNPSERKNCIPPTRITGRNTIATTTIPSPPDHCSSPRQRCTPSLSAPSSGKAVAPVVLRPDIASNMASVKPAPATAARIGMAPMTGSTSHSPEVSRNACSSVSVRPSCRVASITIQATSAVPAPVAAKIRQLAAPADQSTAAGAAIITPMTMASLEIAWITGRTSIMAP